MALQQQQRNASPNTANVIASTNNIPRGLFLFKDCFHILYFRSATIAICSTANIPCSESGVFVFTTRSWSAATSSIVHESSGTVESDVWTGRNASTATAT